MSLTLALTGDSIATRRHALPSNAETESLLALLGDSDVSFTNLEVVPTDFRGYPRGSVRGTYLNAPSLVIDDLVSAGMSAFSCANNHALNFGVDGVTTLIDNLDRRGVAYSGIGMNLARARMPAYVDGGNGSCAVISCTSTFRPGEQAARQRDDFVGRPGLNPVGVDTVYEVTEEQLRALRQISEELGLERVRQHAVQTGMRRPDHPDPGRFGFLDRRFRLAERPAVRSSCVEPDLADILRWLREARRRSDVVVVSVHSHEHGPTDSAPAEFLVDFAHAVIDEGADVVVGHGPHCLRGMELYRGRPIFYSLGNFISQIEYVTRLPSEAYEYAGVGPDATPADVFERKSDGGTRGFAAQSKYWRSVVPVCRFSSGRLESLTLNPVELGHDRPPPRRGTPRRVTGTAAAAIVESFGELSAPFGVRLRMDGDVAQVDLDCTGEPDRADRTTA